MAQRPKPATNLRISFLPFGPLVAQQERARKQDQHTYGNGRISKIEDQKRPPFADVKIGKIHHIAKAHPIKDIAKRAAQHETQRENVAACLFPPHPNRNETSDDGGQANQHPRSDAHTYELQTLMRISYAVFCLKK